MNDWYVVVSGAAEGLSQCWCEGGCAAEHDER